MNRYSIEFLRIHPLRGPNQWTYRPVIEAWVDIGKLEDAPSNTIPGLHDRLSAWLPSLIEHRCSVGERGGFLRRVREGTWAAHILEHVALELQNQAGQRTGFGKARGTARPGVYRVVVRSRQEEVTRACLLAARDLVLAAIEDRPYDVPSTIAGLRDIADSHCLGPSTACIVAAATERRIPSIRLSEGNLVQLGYGAASRRIWTAETDQTSAIAESISRDKGLTKDLLRTCGVPVPEGRLVTSPQDAWAAALEIGLPVVVKPTDANHGRGVAIDLTTRADVEAAYAVAREEGSGVIVERFVRGQEHRLLVVGGRVVAAARGEAAWVRGDGRSTVRQLIDAQLNSDPRRGTTDEYPLNVILLDEDPVLRFDLERQGFGPESIPPEGREVLIQRNGNVAMDVTDLLHPGVAQAASLATRVVGLDIAGVDLVAQDISRPLEGQGGAIIEVNAGPGLHTHLKPADGNPRPVGQAIIANLFPEGVDGRIPIVGVAGTSGTTAVARLVAWLLVLSGRSVGLACRDGLFLDRRQVDKGNCATWRAGHNILLNRAVEAAVIENGCDTLVTDGLAYDRCQIGIVTQVAPVAGLEEYEVQDRDQVAGVLRTQVDVVLPGGMAVLNADDPLVAEMASLCDGEVVFFGSPDGTPLAEHRSRRGRAVLVRDGRLILAVGPEETPLVNLTAQRPSGSDASDFRTASIAAATAAAWVLGVPIEVIRAGIETFEPDQPGLSRVAVKKKPPRAGEPRYARLAI